MEQRIGRIDRVRSLTDRRLSAALSAPSGEELLQVYYPHLDDTVEVLQVQRVLERMNVFLRLMHEGLTVPKGETRRIDVARELTRGQRSVEVIQERLRSAFPIPDWALTGNRRVLAAGAETSVTAPKRSRSDRGPPVCMSSIAQHASPKSMYQSDDFRVQLSMASTCVVTMNSGIVLISDIGRSLSAQAARRKSDDGSSAGVPFTHSKSRFAQT